MGPDTSFVGELAKFLTHRNVLLFGPEFLVFGASLSNKKLAEDKSGLELLSVGSELSAGAVGLLVSAFLLAGANIRLLLAANQSTKVNQFLSNWFVASWFIMLAFIVLFILCLWLTKITKGKEWLGPLVSDFLGILLLFVGAYCLISVAEQV